jgi:choline transport protein
MDAQFLDGSLVDAVHMDDAKLQMTASANDDAQLARLGHVQELRRDFSIKSLGGLCLCLMATWEALSTVVATALNSGGAPCLFYN